MKLRKNYGTKNKTTGKSYLSNYTFTIKTTEARELEFVDEEDNSYELEKIIDLENKQIIIKKK